VVPPFAFEMNPFENIFISAANGGTCTRGEGENMR
jgi:hypothetical protein